MPEFWRRTGRARLERLRRRHAYSYRGERERRARRLRRALLVAGLGASAALVVVGDPPAVAAAAAVRPAPVSRLLARRPVAARADVPAPLFVPAEERATRAHRDVVRWNRVYRFAHRYGISSDLAGAIHDAALSEGLEPELAFRLVQTESEFNERARSPVGAVGLTQLMPSTARYFVGPVTRERLYDRHLNLRVGFRYLRGLIREYKSLRLALLVYNRGPRAVAASLADGRDPANGYDALVTKGYRGRGTID